MLAWGPTFSTMTRSMTVLGLAWSCQLSRIHPAELSIADGICCCCCIGGGLVKGVLVNTQPSLLSLYGIKFTGLVWILR